MSPRPLRTLWLVGFTCAVAGLSCESGGGRCVDDPTLRYFNVHWEIDSGSASVPLPPLSCNDAPRSHVELTTNTNQTLQVGKECHDGTFYNFLGSTNGGLAVGTTATFAELISDDDGTVLSTAATPNVAIGGCSGVDLQIQFPLTP